MSFFVTRPPAPVPATWLGSTPCSDAIRATTGETNALPLPLAAGAAAGGAAAGARLGGGFRRRGLGHGFGLGLRLRGRLRCRSTRGATDLPELRPDRDGLALLD